MRTLGRHKIRKHEVECGWIQLKYDVVCVNQRDVRYEKDG